MIAEGLLNLPLPPTIMLILILVVIFVLGWPLEWVPIVLIVVPILLPLVQKLGIDLIWFCTLVAVCLQTAWLSPPVALSAYFLKGVVPDWKLSDIYAGMMQFMVLQVIGLGCSSALPAACRHDAVHGSAVDRAWPHSAFPAARALASRGAEKLNSRRAPVSALAQGCRDVRFRG